MSTRPRHPSAETSPSGTLVALLGQGRTLASVRDSRPNAPVRSLRARTTVAAARIEDDERGATLLTEAELQRVEQAHAEGLTAAQIVEIFAGRGVKFSEASFRKYIQLGLLPRSRRVGRKGKFRGSLGLYPAKTVRRINAIKEWMAAGYTIEDIQAQFLLYTDLLEGLEEGLEELWTRLGEDAQRLSGEARAKLERELSEARREAASLVRRMGDLTKRVLAPRTSTYRRSGAAGSAEDLL